jgi:sec-independent protein translocase protein TatA
MPSIGPLELVVVLIIALVVLGPKKLPDVGRSVGRGMREFKNAVTGGGDDDAKPQPTPIAPAASHEDAPQRTAA